ncbi:hypothetical protein PM082_013940 [Marasmius tenuissimus]|nr:hypothetical protein PM082_013940 [Marasmius tenuissimus]
MEVLNGTSSTLQSFNLKGYYLLEEDPDDSDSDGSDFSTDSITLPHLHTLYVHFSQKTTGRSLALIFDHIVALSLLDLHFDVWIDGISETPFLSNFLLRSQCRLHWRLAVGIREGFLTVNTQRITSPSA